MTKTTTRTIQQADSKTLNYNILEFIGNEIVNVKNLSKSFLKMKALTIINIMLIKEAVKDLRDKHGRDPESN